MEPLVDDAVKLLGYGAITVRGYEATRLYGHIAVNTESRSEIVNLLQNQFNAEPIRTFPIGYAETALGVYRKPF